MDLLLTFQTQGFKANPGLELANAFSVIKDVLRSSDVADLFLHLLA